MNAMQLHVQYFADRYNTVFIITKQEKKYKRPVTFVICAKTVTDLKNAEQNLKKMGFCTFNKDVNIWNVFDPEWLIKNRVFSMKIV